MQPIYEDLIKMWKNYGFDYEIYPGTFWLDNSIVKAFDRKGNLRFLYRIFINDSLEISFKKHSNCPSENEFDFETWQETANRMKPVFNCLFYSYIIHIYLFRLFLIQYLFLIMLCSI